MKEPSERAHRADVIVIGAGIAGASAAAELAPSCRVLLVEMEDQPGFHTTGRSAAVFAEAYGNGVVRALTRASRRFLAEPPPAFSDQPLLLPRGWMFVARSDQVERLEELSREIGGSLRAMSSAEALERVPILRREYLAGALWDETAKDIDVHALHQGYLRRFRAAGGEVLLGCRVLGLRRTAESWRLETSRGGLAAPLVVNAAGAWAEEIGRLAGAVTVGLVPMRRTVVLLDPPPGVDIARWPLVIDAEEQFYFKPESGKLLVSPADETPSPACDVHPEDLEVALAVDRITRACALDVRSVFRKWAGLRSFVPDRTPVAGFDPRARGFFWVAGQGGYGIQTAPALGRLAAALVLGKAIPEEAAAEGVSAADLSPARFDG